MPWSESLYWWLVYSAVLSMIVLACGGCAMLLYHQPSRRLRIIELTLVGCLVAPWLGAIPGYPQLAIRWPGVMAPQTVASSAVSPGVPSGATNLATTEPAIASDVPRFAQNGMAGVPLRPTAEPIATPSRAWSTGSWLVALYVLGVAMGLAWWLVGLVALVRIIWTAETCAAAMSAIVDRDCRPAQYAGALADKPPSKATACLCVVARCDRAARESVRR